MQRRLGVAATAPIAVMLIAACTAPVGQQQQPSPRAPSPADEAAKSATISEVLPIDASMAAVSASQPTPEAAKALAECNIGSQIEITKVTGMGQVADGSALTRYVPLTGREPQLKDDGPIWIVTVRASLPQPGSTEVWVDPTCVVTPTIAGWFATGPVLDRATGETITPEAPRDAPTLRVPPLAP